MLLGILCLNGIFVAPSGWPKYSTRSNAFGNSNLLLEGFDELFTTSFRSCCYQHTYLVGRIGYCLQGRTWISTVCFRSVKAEAQHIPALLNAFRTAQCHDTSPCYIMTSHEPHNFHHIFCIARSKPDGYIGIF